MQQEKLSGRFAATRGHSAAGFGKGNGPRWGSNRVKMKNGCELLLLNLNSLYKGLFLLLLQKQSLFLYLQF